MNKTRGKPQLKTLMALVLAVIVLFGCLPTSFAANEPSYTTGDVLEVTAGTETDAGSISTGDAGEVLVSPPEQAADTTGPPATEGVPYPDPPDTPAAKAASGGISTMSSGTSVSNDQSMHMYYTRFNGSYWQPMQTPTHYSSDGRMAYCLEQVKGSPVGYGYSETTITTGQSINVNGSEFHPAVLEGLCAIVRAGYPASTLGMPADAARQTTAVAIRVYLAESGHSHMMQPGMSGFQYVGLADGTPASYLETCKNLVQIGHDAKNSYTSTVIFEIKSGTHDVKADGTVRIRKQKDSNGYYIDSYKTTFEIVTNGVTSYEIVTSRLNGVKASRNGDIWTLTGSKAQFDGMTLSFNVTTNNYTSGFSLLIGDSTAAQTLLSVPGTIPETPPTRVDPPNPPDVEEPVKGILKVKKVDNETGKPIEGARFQIWVQPSDLKWRKIAESAGGIITTDSTGVATSGELECEQRYRVEEIDFVPGYWETETTGEIWLVQGMNTGKTDPDTGKKFPNGMIELGNTPIKTEITIEKRDPETGTNPQGEAVKSYEGAVFSVYADEHIKTPTGEVALSIDALAGTVTLGADGKGTIKDLYPGRYRIVETSGPSAGNYFINPTPIKVTTDTGDSKSQVVKFDTVYKDDAKKYIVIRKNDDKTGDISQGNSTFTGAEFKIVANMDIYDAGGVLIHKKGDLVQGRDTRDSATIVGSRLLTGSDARVRSQALYPGRYLVYEIKPSEGMYWNREPIEVDVTSAGNGGTREVVFEKPFSNEVQKGSIQINKIKGDNNPNYDPEGSELELETGAKFEVFLKSAGSYENAKETERCIMVTGYDQDGNKYTDPTYAGYAISPLLPYGVYTVRQVEGTPGHALMDDVTVFVYDDELLLPAERPKKPTDNLYPVVMNNHRLKTLVEIYKIDSVSGLPVIYSGATFEVYQNGKRVYDIVNENGELKAVYEFTTDSKGRILLPIGYRTGYGVGEYKLVEIQAPENYYRKDKELTFEVTDEMIKNAKPEYILSSMPSLEDFYSEGITEAEKEKAREEYEQFIADNTYPVITFEYENVPVLGRITINKSGMLFSGVEEEKTEYGTVYKPIFKHGKLGGCTFIITAKEDIISGDGVLQAAAGDVVDTLVTTSNKTDSSKLLYPGLYEVTEDPDNMPAGYVLTGKVYTVEIKSEGQDVELTETAVAIGNLYQKAEIKIEKLAEVLDAPEKEDESGQYIREIKELPGSGFVFGLFADEYVDQNGHAVDVTDIELNEETIEELGIVIEKGNLVAVGTTSDDGTLSFSGNFPHIRYYIQELGCPDNYILDDTQYPVDFTYNRDVTKIEAEPVELVNRLRMYEIEITKEDITNSEPVPGALIEITDFWGNVLHRECTPEDGTLKFKIEPGKYKFRETIIVDGFYENTNVMNFEVSKEGEVSGDHVLQNTPTEIKITKLDAFKNTPLDGAQFELVDASGATVLLKKHDDGFYYPSEDGEAHFTTTDGEAIIRYLTAGGSYTVYERVAAPGFALDETGHMFEVGQKGGFVGGSILNYPTELVINKVAADSGKPLAGVRFELKNENGGTVNVSLSEDGTYYYPDENGTATFETLENGIAAIKYLPAGQTYTAYEREAAAGYLKSDTPYEFVLSETGEVTGPEEIKNEPTKLTLRKTSGYDGTLLDGSEFEILDENGNTMLFAQDDSGYYPVAMFGSSVIKLEKGEAVVRQLPVGKKILVVERKAPSGYSILEEPVEHTITEDGTIEGPEDIVNGPAPMLVVTKKNNADDSLLDGAVFKLIDIDGNDIKLTKGEDGIYYPSDEGAAEFVTTNGVATIKGLPPTLVRLLEVQAPAGFTGYENPIDIPLETKHNEENPFLVTIYNAPGGSEGETPPSVTTGSGAQTGGDGLPYVALFAAICAGIVACRFIIKYRKNKKAAASE